MLTTWRTMGLADTDRHVIGLDFSRETRAHNALDDVVGDRSGGCCSPHHMKTIYSRNEGGTKCVSTKQQCGEQYPPGPTFPFPFPFPLPFILTGPSGLSASGRYSGTAPTQQGQPIRVIRYGGSISRMTMNPVILSV